MGLAGDLGPLNTGIVWQLEIDSESPVRSAAATRAGVGPARGRGAKSYVGLNKDVRACLPTACECRIYLGK